MGVKIVYSNFATLDIKEIFDFIKKGSVYYAKKEINDLRLVIKKLKGNVYLGKKFEKADDEFTRELIFKNYRIIYLIVSETAIEILTIHHHARSLSKNSAFNPED